MSKSVCVVLPVYNAQEWVERAIKSVQDSFGDALIVAVDDGSSDGSVDVLKGISPAIIVETGPNRGACHARNRGLAIAGEHSADYVLFLDADDEISEDMLSGISTHLESASPDILFSAQHRAVDGTTVSEHRLHAQELTPSALFELWLARPQLNPGSITWRTEFLRDIGGWSEDVLINQDGELVLRAMLHAPRLGWNDQGFSIYNVGKTISLSTNKSHAKLDNYVSTLARLLQQADAASFTAHCKGIEKTLYGVARMAFRHGWQDVGRRALAVLKDRGIYQHHGSWPHKMIARLIGLETKVRLWKS